MLPKTTKDEIKAWRTGAKRMNSEVVHIDGQMYEKIVVDPNNTIFKPIAEEQVTTRKKREPKPSDEPKSNAG